MTNYKMTSDQLLTPHQKAALDYTQHIALTANAGSGKTFVLSRRYVEIAISEELSLSNIAAITFTDKAAGELYKKIADEINNRLLTVQNSQEKRKLDRIRRQLVSANISTIHSFCINILREFPLEAQLDANFTPIDKNLSDELIQLSIEEVIKSATRDENRENEFKYLVRLFGSKNIFQEEIFSLIEQRKKILKIAGELYSRSEEEIADYFFEVFKNRSKAILSKDLTKVISSIRRINNNVLNTPPANKTALEIEDIAERIISEKEIIKILDLLNQLKPLIFTNDCKVRKKGYLSKERELLSTEITFIEKYFSDIDCYEVTENHREIEMELARFGKILIHFFNNTLEIYEHKKRQQGYLDFEDILITTQKILNISEVADELSKKYKYIMVDEFQDTNELQYEIFMPILNHLKKGNLFVVGDDKQSIYMFRDAELEVFEKTRNDIAEKAGYNSLLNLPDSFRMSPAICLFTNYLFQTLFKEPNAYFNEVGNNELVCGRDPDEKGKIEFILAENSKEQINEAELISRRIIQITSGNDLGEDISFGEIAILCRKRKSFEELEKAFNKYNIPFIIVGGKGFYQRQIIYDIYNYLSFLINQDNDVSLAGILRSPFFSVSDAELFEISLEKEKTFWFKLQSYSVNSMHIQKIVSLLKENIQLSNNLYLASLLRKILNETGYISIISSRRNSEQELANIEKLIGIANSFSRQGFKTLYDFITYLNQAINTLEDEGHAAIAQDINSIKIMTLHQAKGLEFKAVFLFNAHDYTQRDSVKSKSISISKEYGILTAVPLNENYFEKYKAAPVINLHNCIIKRKNLAEIKRLLYVGITRAKNYLFISASHKNYSFNHDSFMYLLVHGLGIDFKKETIPLRSTLKFLVREDDNYNNITKELNLDIPVVTSIEEIEPLEKNKEQVEQTSKEIRINEIIDSQKAEIISATKIAVFKQCPLKYQLTYEFGYMNLFRSFKSSVKNYDFNAKEDEENSFADTRGRIIHKILEQEYSFEKTEMVIDELIRSETNLIEIKEENILNLKNSILQDLTHYFNSECYKEIQSYSNYKNEFEIYSCLPGKQENDEYYLYGIIDKLVFENDSIIVIDYKTDNIQVDEIQDRVNNYLPQLKFYAFIISRLYKNAETFQVKLIFIKHTDIKVVVQFTKDEVETFGTEIKEIVNRIRNNDFQKDTTHCENCYYSINGKCIR